MINSTHILVLGLTRSTRSPVHYIIHPKVQEQATAELRIQLDSNAKQVPNLDSPADPFHSTGTV